MNIYKVTFGSRISSSKDFCYLMAENEMEALSKGKKMLDAHKLSPEFLNKLGRYSVVKV